MTVYYCSSADVYNFLYQDVQGTLTDFTATTIPTKAAVEKYIARAESRIDEYMEKSWRPNTVTDEKHTLRFPRTTMPFVYYPLIRLRHRPIRTFTADTDYLYIWDGGTEIDWIANKTEGLGNDYYVNYETGTIQILRGWPILHRIDNIRVTYRYGDDGTTIPGWVEDLCVKIAAKEVLRFDKSHTRTGGAEDPDRPTAVVNMVELREEIKEELALMYTRHGDRRADWI